MKNGIIMNDFNALRCLILYLPMKIPNGNPIASDIAALANPWYMEFLKACLESAAAVPFPKNMEKLLIPEKLAA
jgi:hypothetical protein